MVQNEEYMTTLQNLILAERLQVEEEIEESTLPEDNEDAEDVIDGD